VAQTRAQAMKRNIDEAGQTATVWQGSIESKTTVCPSCGKPAGVGAFCSNCGADMTLKECPKCGAKNARTVSFCNGCGQSLAAAAQPDGKCPSCGEQNAPGAKFCNSCGAKMGAPAPVSTPSADAAACPSCGAANPAGTKFCRECGAKIEAPAVTERSCPNCGAPVPAANKFCGGCGHRFE
jgi:predicted amidophosphoribosyltransferase